MGEPRSVNVNFTVWGISGQQLQTGGSPCVSSECTRMLHLLQGKTYVTLSDCGCQLLSVG